MRLTTLRCHHYRNLSGELIAFSPGINVIVGANAQGKTNVIEAIHFLALTKSFRCSDNSELVRWGEKDLSVFGTVEYVASDLQFEIGVSLERGKKGLYFNKERLNSVTEYLGRLVMVSFSPSDISLIKGAPSGRRRFLDKHLVDLLPSTITPLLNYQRALQHKNALLKQGVGDVAMLDSWNKILAHEGNAIVKARLDFIQRLEQSARQLLRHFAPHDGELSLALESNASTEHMSEEALYAKLEEGRSREIHYRSAVIGPHRDDLAITLGGKDARAFSSQGQARSLVLALTIAVLELLEKTRGEAPLVLLDDVNSELDSARSDAFFELVLHKKRQIFLTGTDASLGHLQGEQGYSLLQVEEGRVTQL